MISRDWEERGMLLMVQGVAFGIRNCFGCRAAGIQHCE